ncbi:MAG: ribosomal-processing cysteine protease Prp [Tissierellia bacterium]|nr:ribosomal-processing cysteine protease Prp [Tissierellia bacterium]
MHRFILYRSGGYIRGFQASGHADSDSPTGDVVCNGVSALTQTAVLSAHQLVPIPEDQLKVGQRDGYLYLWILKGHEKPETQTILESMMVGLREIEKNYSKFLKISIQEVDHDPF